MKSAAERYNDRMHSIFEKARQLEHARLEAGEMPNPNLTSPQEANKYGWYICYCGAVRRHGQSCGCFDNNCQ